jgi:hypothetical protein
MMLRGLDRYPLWGNIHQRIPYISISLSSIPARVLSMAYDFTPEKIGPFSKKAISAPVTDPLLQYRKVTSIFLI